MSLRAVLPLLVSGVMAAGWSLPAGATTLDEAIAAAMAHAPEVQAARADSDAAEARIGEARSGGLPSATAEGLLGYGYLDPRHYFNLAGTDVTPRVAKLTVEQALFTGGRVGAGVDEARAGSAMARAGEAATRSGIVAAVAQAYGNVLTAGTMVELYDRLVGEMQEIHRQAQVRFRDGESPSTDVQQAAARLAEAQAGLAQAEGMAVSAKARFSNLTGLDAAGLQSLPADPPLPATLDEAMEAAVRANPSLAQAEAGVRAAQAAERGARAERLPTVGAFAEGATVRDQFFPGYKADSATIGVRARWQLFSGGRVTGHISETGHAVQAAEARLRAARSQVEEQVIGAFQGVRTARLVETAAEQQSVSARQALESVRQEVRVGMKPQLALLDAEREALAAAAASARARTDRIVAAYRLMSVIGQ